MRKRNRKNDRRRVLHAFNCFNILYFYIENFNCCLIFLINNYLFDICWGRVNIDLVYSFSYIHNHLWLSWPLSHGTIDYVTTTLDPVEATSACRRSDQWTQKATASTTTTWMDGGTDHTWHEFTEEGGTIPGS